MVLADLYEAQAVTADEASRHRKLWSAVVLAALDDAIVENRRFGNGTAQIKRWSESRDGREVLQAAGIEPSEIVTQALGAFVDAGVRTSVALSREESTRRAEADDRTSVQFVH